MRENNNLSTLVICNNIPIMGPWRFCSFRWESHRQYFNNVWHFWFSLSRLMTKSGQSCGTALKWRSSNGRVLISQLFKVKVEEEMSWCDFGDQRNLFPSWNDKVLLASSGLALSLHLRTCSSRLYFQPHFSSRQIQLFNFKSITI